MRFDARSLLLAGGVIAFLVASLSIADMFVRRPYDGVVLEADVPGSLVVRQVLPGSGAARAGIAAGDQIVGIDRNALRSVAHAAEILNRRQIGDRVPYFLRGSGGEVREAWVELGPRRMGSLPYLMACVLGFAFFFVGAGVLNRQPKLRAAQVFFGVCVLFLLFLVCRLRPASYTWVDTFVLTTGTAALLFLPAVFLHFFLIFPRPVALRPEPDEADFRRRRRRWVLLIGAIYLLPPLVYVVCLLRARFNEVDVPLISGAPAESWWTLALYLATGLGVLAWQALRLDDPRERSGVALVFFGALFGLLPFLYNTVVHPSVLHTDSFLIYGVAPLALVPLTFAYAIVRFGLLDIRVILRKSLLYTVTTATVTALYALGIALLTRVSSATELTASPLFPVVFALVILLLFEPVRRRIQVVVDRWFLAERTSLELEIQEIRDTLMARREVQGALEELVGRLPRLLGLHFAGLYRWRRDHLERAAGPEILPATLDSDERLDRELERRDGLASVDQLRRALGREELGPLAAIRDSDVELVGDLSTPRRKIGWLVLSGKTGQFSFDSAELDLLKSLLRQSALALETSLLLEERTQQAEYERELEIAASVQSELLPSTVSFGPGWTVEAVCRPARHVGGDFFTQLPGLERGSSALVYGDVAGKSVAGALVMMAAYEALHSIALSDHDPEHLFDLANQRLYGLGRRKSFVALAYLAVTPGQTGLDYLLAGQPQPLLRAADGEVRELPLPENRLPLGALVNGGYHRCHAPMRPGDLLLGYSDGVLDARSPHGEPFGIERLERVVAAAPPQPDELLADVLGALEAFTRGTEPYDDVTLVAISRDREEAR